MESVDRETASLVHHFVLPPADLTAPQTKAKSDKDLRAVILDGRGAMPAWKNRLKEQDIQNVLAYIRSLGE